MKTNRQDGVALVLAVLMTFALSVLTASLMLVSRTETWSGMNHRQLAQARYGAEAGMHQTANYLLNTYTPPGGAGDALANYNLTVSPVTYNGSPVILSSMSAVASNYPVPSAITAFQAGTTGSLSVGNSLVSYRSFATLVSMRQIIQYGSPTPLTVQTWRITAAGSIPGSRGAMQEVSSVLEQQLSPTFTYAVFSTGNGCSSLSFSGGGTVDSFDSANRQAQANMAHHDHDDGDFHGGQEEDHHHGDGDNHDGEHHQGDGDDDHHGDEDGAHHHGDGDNHDGIHHEGDGDDDHGAGHGANDPVDPAVNVLTQAWGGNVGTNGNTGENHATVKGSLSTPRAGLGNCSANSVTALSASNGATVTGGVTELPQTLSYQAPAAANPLPPTGNVNISRGGCPGGLGNSCSVVGGAAPGLALTPGSYADLNVHSGDALHLSAGTYNVNSLTANGGTVVLDSGPVVVNVAGQNQAVPVDFTGGGIVNASLDAGQLQIQYSGNGQINLAGGAQAAATIYAPSASVNLTNNADFFGAVIANTFDDTSGALIHFDRHLVNSFFTVGGYMLHSFTWKKF